VRSASEPSTRRVRTSVGVGIAIAVGVGVVVTLGLQVVSISYSGQQALLVGSAFAVAATAWGLFAGFGGQFSFGHAALFGVPAYGAYLLNDIWGVPPLIGLVCSAVGLSLLSLVLVGPALRLRGPYFALVTLAMAEVARRLVNANPDITGGEDGRALPSDQEGILYLNSSEPTSYIAWLAGLLVITVLVFWLFLRSRTGRALTAVRDDEDIASSTGVNATIVKMTAFVLSGIFIGLAGGIYAYSTHIVSSDALLGTTVSIAILVYATVGGMRSLYGPLIGAFILTFVEERLRSSLGAIAPNLYAILYAVVFALLLYFAPLGLVGLAQSAFAALCRRRSPEPAADVPGPLRASDASSPAHVLADISSAQVRELLAELEPLERGSYPAVDERLVVSDLVKRFGGVVVNDGISFELASHQSLGVWGPNGSGKSTLINQLGGQLRATSGSMTFGGTDFGSLAPYARARLGIVRASQQARLYDAQSVLDNVLTTLFTTKRLNPLRESDFRQAVELCRRAVDAVGLPMAKLDVPAGSLSTGQRKRLEIARLLVGHRPRLILLDEPTAGIDRAGIPLLASVLRAVQKGTSASLVVVDHDQDFLLSVAPEVMCLGNGKVVDIVRADDAHLTERLGAAVRRAGAEPEVGTEARS